MASVAAKPNLPRSEVGDHEPESKVVRAVQTLLKAGYQIEPAALSLLQSAAKSIDAEQVAQTIIEQKTSAEPLIFITKSAMEAALNTISPPEPMAIESPSPTVARLEGAETGKAAYCPYAREIEPQIEILRDPTREISPIGDLDNFLAYFRDRYKKLRRITRQRLDAKDAVTLAEALRQQLNSRVTTLGMVSEKIDRGSKIILRLDDPEASATILVKPSKPGLLEKAQMILLDQIICVQGVKGGNDLIVAEDLLWPEIPNHRPVAAAEPVCAVLTSDFHIGSKIFEKTLVDRFLLWLGGRLGTATERELAGNVKYIVIAGDLVDGIGVYPLQENELEVSDIYAQYEMAARYLERIPEYIEVILIPGNHDAVRRALPQPRIPEKYAGPAYKARRLVSLGNPAQVRIHGVNLLIHHGRSLEDLLATLPNVNRANPTRALVQILRTRHLAPVYGGKTPLAPESKDLLVIEDVPDIYHTGHLHILCYDSYHGTKLVNSGCWQGQTLYQRKMGVTPTYGVAPVMNLQSGVMTPVDFTKMST